MSAGIVYCENPAYSNPSKILFFKSRVFYKRGPAGSRVFMVVLLQLYVFMVVLLQLRFSTNFIHQYKKTNLFLWCLGLHFIKASCGCKSVDIKLQNLFVPLNVNLSNLFEFRKFFCIDLL